MPIYNLTNNDGDSISFESDVFIENIMIPEDSNVCINTTNGVVYIDGITNIECECNNREFTIDVIDSHLFYTHQTTYNIQCDRWGMYSDIINYS